MTQGRLVPFVLHPVLSRYLLKLDIGHRPTDRDYDLPSEEMTSPAVHPPLSRLTLESTQEYLQPITVDASSTSPSTGVTVQDVLRTIHEDMGKPLRSHEWDKLTDEERAAVDDEFRRRCRTREELAQGPCGADYLCRRDRLQILPPRKLPVSLLLEDEMSPALIIPEVSREALPLLVNFL